MSSARGIRLGTIGCGTTCDSRGRSRTVASRLSSSPRRRDANPISRRASARSSSRRRNSVAARSASAWRPSPVSA